MSSYFHGCRVLFPSAISAHGVRSQQGFHHDILLKFVMKVWVLRVCVSCVLAWLDFVAFFLLDIAAMACRFIGHVREDDDSITSIANCEGSLQKARAVWEAVASTHSTAFCASSVQWTPLGVHDEQLTIA